MRFVITLNRAVTRSADLRVVVEVKDRNMSAPAVRGELREARENRCAAVALIVFSKATALAGVDPFDLRDGDVYCVIDPEAPDLAVLEGAVGLARLLALGTLANRAAGHIDAERVRRALESAQNDLAAFISLKARVTKSANDLSGDLTRLQNTVSVHVAEAIAELNRAAAEETQPS